MKILAAFLSIIFIGSLSFARTPLDELFMMPNANYVQAVVSSSNTVANNLVTRSTAGAKTFYLDSLTIEGYLSTISATAARLGSCSLMVPAGTTVATFNFVNPTTSALDRVVWHPRLPVIVPTSMGVVCTPVSGNTSTINWSVNYGGFEY